MEKCIFCGRTGLKYNTCKDSGKVCDEKRLDFIEKKRKLTRGPIPLDAGRTFSDRIRDAEYMQSLNDDDIFGYPLEED